jgi:hypothetical protein
MFDALVYDLEHHGMDSHLVYRTSSEFMRALNPALHKLVRNFHEIVSNHDLSSATTLKITVSPHEARVGKSGGCTGRQSCKSVHQECYNIMMACGLQHILQVHPEDDPRMPRAVYTCAMRYQQSPEGHLIRVHIDMHETINNMLHVSMTVTRDPINKVHLPGRTYNQCNRLGRSPTYRYHTCFFPFDGKHSGMCVPVLPAAAANALVAIPE